MPTVRTAFLDFRGAATSQGSTGENIHHYTGVRMRVIGSGYLEMTLFTQDSVRSVVLSPFPMSGTSERSPFRITSFVTQRAQLELSTDEINEIFRINRIIIYSKPIAMEYPA
jgi:hypothetical protein